jgi:hypothetical protein
MLVAMTHPAPVELAQIYLPSLGTTFSSTAAQHHLLLFIVPGTPCLSRLKE